MRIQVRNLSQADITEANRLEAGAWPEDVQASSEKLIDRYHTFAAGFFGAFSSNRLVGMASSQIISYADKSRLVSWAELTADGWISKTHQPSGNCLHFVSICVDPGIRHLGVATQLNEARLQVARDLGLKCALTDTRLPGLRRYLEANPPTGPEKYVEDIIAGAVSEPVVEMYLKFGFLAMGLIPNCMIADDESANYGLAMLKVLRP